MTLSMSDALAIVIKLAKISDLYIQNRLRDAVGSYPSQQAVSEIEMFSGRGGKELLCVSHAFIAKHFLKMDGAAEYGVIQGVLNPLAKIADAYDANELDNEARKHWGLHNEHTNKTDPDDIVLISCDGGSPLLTLGDALRAREFINTQAAIAA